MKSYVFIALLIAFVGSRSYVAMSQGTNNSIDIILEALQKGHFQQKDNHLEGSYVNLARQNAGVLSSKTHTALGKTDYRDKIEKVIDEAIRLNISLDSVSTAPGLGQVPSKDKIGFESGYLLAWCTNFAIEHYAYILAEKHGIDIMINFTDQHTDTSFLNNFSKLYCGLIYNYKTNSIPQFSFINNQRMITYRAVSDELVADFRELYEEGVISYEFIICKNSYFHSSALEVTKESEALKGLLKTLPLAAYKDYVFKLLTPPRAPSPEYIDSLKEVVELISSEYSMKDNVNSVVVLERELPYMLNKEFLEKDEIDFYFMKFHKDSINSNFEFLIKFYTRQANFSKNDKEAKSHFELSLFKSLRMFNAKILFPERSYQQALKDAMTISPSTNLYSYFQDRSQDYYYIWLPNYKALSLIPVKDRQTIIKYYISNVLKQSEKK